MIRPAGPALRLVADAFMQAHPTAEIFPMMSGADFDALVADIKANGQREPIITTDGLILDGRNRARACEQLGIAAITAEWDRKGTPEAFVISMNLHRRHLNESQRAMIAAKLVNTKQGQRPDMVTSSNLKKCSASDAAALLSVSAGSVSSARKVLSEASTDEIAAIERGDETVGAVAKGIRAGLPPDRRQKKRDAPLGQRGDNPERIQRMQVNADIWAKLSDALMGLTSLPLPQDVAEIINANPNRRRIVDERLTRALQYLKGLEDACQRSD